MLYETKGIKGLVSYVSGPNAIEYLTQDVETLAELFDKTYKTMKAIDVDILKNPTIGSSVMSMFKEKGEKLTKE
jgi:ribosomal protein L10